MNKYIFFQFLLFINILSSQTKSNLNDFLFPLKLQPNYTSNFGEYRANHLHGGIDISTNSRTGIEVVATRNGYIEQIKVSPNGYGKNISIKHEDGYTSFYAHLKNFPANLENIILREQIRNQNYTVNLKFKQNEIPVEQGDVIAFSGESGAGGPHLHFEIFDEKEQLINPLNFTKIRNVIDVSPPAFTSFVVMPLSNQTKIGHNILPQKYIPEKLTPTKFKINETIHIDGVAAFGVEIIDNIDNRDDRLLQKNLILKIDNFEILNISRDYQRQSDARQVSLVYDFNLISKFKDKIQKLFIDENNKVPFYNSFHKSNGILSNSYFSNGFHSFEVIAEDFVGNVSTLNGNFLLTKLPEFSVLKIDEENISIQIDSLKNITKIETAFFDKKKKEWTKYKYPIKDKNLIYSIPFHEKNSSIRKISIQSTDGASSFPIIVSNHASENIEAEIETEIYRDNLFLILKFSSTLKSNPSLLINFNKEIFPVETFQLDENTFIASLPNKITGRFVTKLFYFSGTEQIEKINEFDFNKLFFGKAGNIKSSDNILNIKFTNSTLQSNAFFNISRNGDNAYKVKHTAGVFNDGVTINYKIESKILHNKKYALYSGSVNDWNFASKEINYENSSFEILNSRTINSYKIIEDLEKPIIDNLKINPFYKDNSWLLQFILKDKISGVSSSSIIIKLDGERIFPDFDTEKEKVLYFPLKRIKVGNHQISIQATDNVGNVATYNKTFKLIF